MNKITVPTNAVIPATIFLIRLLLVSFFHFGVTYPVPQWAHASVIQTVQGFQGSIVEVLAGDTSGHTKGAGVIVRSDGLIVTNLHVVHGAPLIRVRQGQSAPYAVQVTRIYPEYDLALLKINPAQSLPPVNLAPADRLQLQQTVYHIGSSYLLDGTISEGRISGLGTSKREMKQGNKDFDIIRLDIPLYRGDSGGPLFDRQGRLIGMIVAKDSTRPRVSFAIPVNKIKKILSDIQYDGIIRSN